MMVELKIVVGIIWSTDQQSILVSERLADKAFGGYLEFPGGKVENSESIEQALSRELKEELDISICDCTFYRFIEHVDVDAKTAVQHKKQFYFYHIWCYEGSPKGMEGQKVMWLTLADLKAEHFPPVNANILNELKLKQSLL